MAKTNKFHSSKRISNKKFRRWRKKHFGSTTWHPAKESKKLSPLIETRRKSSGIDIFKYANQGEDEDETINGLSTTQAINAVIDPMNYGWQNSLSNPDGHTDFRGKDIFIKWWKMKYKFTFPSGESSIKEPMRIQLVWGFCTNPTQYTPYTTPKDSTATGAEYRLHAQRQIEDSFNSPDDMMEFRIKNKSNMRILGKKWIRPDRTARVGLPQQYAFGAVGATQPYIEGAPPDVTGTISFPMMRKYRFTHTTNGTGTEMNYNNQSWIPFCIVYMPDFAKINYGDAEADKPKEIVEANRVQFLHNSCVWYQDP